MKKKKIFIHRSSGGRYEIVSTKGRFKQRGEWINAVFYKSEKGDTIYGRTLSDFQTNFYEEERSQVRRVFIKTTIFIALAISLLFTYIKFRS